MFMGNQQSEDKTWEIGSRLLVHTCKKNILKVDYKSIYKYIYIYY